jgi:hypothetical protein
VALNPDNGWGMQWKTNWGNVMAAAAAAAAIRSNQMVGAAAAASDNQMNSLGQQQPEPVSPHIYPLIIPPRKCFPFFLPSFLPGAS